MKRIYGDNVLCVIFFFHFLEVRIEDKNSWLFCSLFLTSLSVSLKNRKAWLHSDALRTT